jgi:hypothetical protein
MNELLFFLITPTFPYDDMLIFQQKQADRPKRAAHIILEITGLHA